MNLRKATDEMRYILATDVGSTTTKARFFHKKDGEWRFLIAGEAPTTVEAPYEDVTMGVRNAVREIEELTGHKLLTQGGLEFIFPYDGAKGIDLYCTTSSAGGGLQMMVAGLMKSVTAMSANKAATGAGAIVMDIIALDDGRRDYEKIQRIRNLRPDMILVGGGTDGGAVGKIAETLEIIKAAEPQPRFGVGYDIPLVYAGNADARAMVKDVLLDDFALSIVDNLRPTLEIEITEPARRAIHELFMEHVMSHAPGYPKLMNWSDVDIMPTPMGEGIAIQLIARNYGTNTIGVGLGGATTNVYSIFDERFVRSVSANLGMSYSICNVMKVSGIDNILRWIPFEVEREDIEDRLRNKMIRPTTIPQTLFELILEHAVAREALRMGMKHHKTIATRLKGARGERKFTVFTSFSDELAETYIDMLKCGVIAGTGGLLSHAPRRVQSLLVLTDGFQPEGVTRLFQDSVFMMPHLGVLSTVYSEAAWQIFDKDCLVRLGTVVAPRGTGKIGRQVMSVDMELPDGSTREEAVDFGDIKRIRLPEGQEIEAVIKPRGSFDVGAGEGHDLETTLHGGVVGIILDARGRPLSLPEERDKRNKTLLKWWKDLNMYPLEKLDIER
ncbi:MAG: glutamate mutase L [Candidatus Bathyarchaeota archaeon]|jgi:uncharacterized protein (TIGR01319 family)